MKIYENLESNIEDLKKNVWNIEKNILSQQGKTIDQHIEKINSLETIIENNSQNISELETKFNNNSQSIETVQSTTNSNTQSIANIQTAIDSTENKLLSIEGIVDSLSQRISDVENSNSGSSNTGTNLLDCFPVGAVYLSVKNTSPASFIGGTWELLETNKALWTSNTTAGDTIDASIPNIKGTLGTLTFRAEWTSSGAFSIDNTGSAYGHNNGSNNHRSAVTFNASNGATVSGIYKDNATTVQPPAIRVFAWKRVA